MDLPVFWIPFLANTAQVEFHRQEFYLFVREKIRKLSIKKKKKKVAITTVQQSKALFVPPFLNYSQSLEKFLSSFQSGRLQSNSIKC